MPELEATRIGALEEEGKIESSDEQFKTTAEEKESVIERPQANVAEYSYWTGIRDLNNVEFAETGEGTMVQEEVKIQEAEPAPESRLEDGSWFAIRLGWMRYFF